MRLLYSLFMYLATPVVLAYFAVRGFRDPRYWQRWGERLGFGPAPARPGAVHVHASSMGEVNAASPLVEALLKETQWPGVLLTTVTPTGSQRAQELFGERVRHCYLPLDLPFAVRRFLRRHQPSMLVIMETEIWPNLIHSAGKQGVPILVANARLSDKSMRGYARAGALLKPAFGRLDQVMAQSAEDAERFVASGVDRHSVTITGNLKFDVTAPASLSEAGEVLRAAWGVTRPVLTAGSTHEDDETELLPAFLKVLARFPNALLILAPRHPERFQEADRMVREAGLNTHLYSQGGPMPGGTQCLVVDTMGELLNFYAAADITFVGGTIAEIGGHNVLEPAALGKPLLVGPHTANVREITSHLVAAGAALRVRNRSEISHETEHLFADAVARDRMGQAGLKLVADGRGALDRTLDVLRRQPG